MRTMYDRFTARYESAMYFLQKIGEDDKYIDMVCFDTQQTLEFLIKHILNVNGTPYRKTHSIGELLALLKSSGFTFGLEDEAVLLADTITSWEAGSRYGEGVYTTIEAIKKVFAIIDSINCAYKSSVEQLKELDVFNH